VQLVPGQENSIDPVHFEWMHDNWSNVMRGADAKAPKHLKLKFEEFDTALPTSACARAERGGPYWTVGRVALWPNGFISAGISMAGAGRRREHALGGVVLCARARGPRAYAQTRVPTWRSPIRDENGRWITSMSSTDIVAWSGRAPSRTDQGICAQRCRISMIATAFRGVRSHQAGGDPKGVIRNPNRRRRSRCPTWARVNIEAFAR